MISALVSGDIQYPAPGESFSPDYRFPEYRFSHIALRPNPVYRAVRQLLKQAGLDGENYGRPTWNPLGKWISPGQSVFVLCNFVYHRRNSESVEEFRSKCTHASVVRAVIDYILIAVGAEGLVRFGNAPLQSCSWRRVLSEAGGEEIETFYKQNNAPVESADLRLFVDETTRAFGPGNVERRDDASGLTIDLGPKSLLTDLDVYHPEYGVSDYNPARTASFHSGGKHEYVLHRHILNSDVIVSVPKMKTHEKVGITCALKGCVGAIGHKDCLAHHRRGAPSAGGDEFRTDPFKFLSGFSRINDIVQRTSAGRLPGRALRLLLRSFRVFVRRLAPTINGAWSGNDTCWRMTLDIARIIAHAGNEGRLSFNTVRPHLGFLDGVVGGEGKGPLAPTPVQSGTLVFADDPVSLDFAAAYLMGFNPAGLSLLRGSCTLKDLPLVNSCVSGHSHSIVNGAEMPLHELTTLVQKPYVPPTGWEYLWDSARREK